MTLPLRIRVSPSTLSVVTATFNGGLSGISNPPELESIRAELIDRPKLDRIFEIHLTDSAGNVDASIKKTIHIRRKAMWTHIRFEDF